MDIGTPAERNARRNAGSANETDRTMTAISDHGTPSKRCARRSRSATAVASFAEDENTCTRAPVAVAGPAASVSAVAGSG